MDTLSPVVIADSLEFNMGSQIDPYQDIKINDDSKYEIILLNSLDISIKGIQRLYYVVYDQYGNETFFSRDIHIMDDSILSSLKPYLTSIIVIIIGGISTYIIWFKYNKSSFDNSDVFKYNIDTKNE
jgi:hypothetical protein